MPLIAYAQNAEYTYQPIGQLYNSKNLGNLYKSVKSKKPTHIIWIGDSHTASDYISGATRDELHNSFGNAGRGFIDGGIPYKGFIPQHLQITTEPEIKILKSYPFGKSDGGPFGLGGYRAVLSDEDKYAITSETGFSNFALCIRSNSKPTSENPENKTPQSSSDFILCNKIKFNYDINASQEFFIAASKDSKMEIASVGMWRNNRGIVLSSFGVPGATLWDLPKRDDLSMKNQIDVLPPALIIIAFGTNEGFSDSFDAEAYKTLLTDQIKRFKKLAPNSDIMLLLAPDANKATINRGDDTSCKNLMPELAAKYPQIAHDELGAGFYIPPNLAKVRKAQRDVANSTNIAYWDWHTAMGGDCSASKLSLLENREIAGDRVHFTKIGGAKIGEKLANDIIEAIKLNLRH